MYVKVTGFSKYRPLYCIVRLLVCERYLTLILAMEVTTIIISILSSLLLLKCSLKNCLLTTMKQKFYKHGSSKRR